MKIIGFILLVLLIALTPTEVVFLSYLHQRVYLNDILIDLLVAELVTICILFYQNEIERVNLKT